MKVEALRHLRDESKPRYAILNGVEIDVIFPEKLEPWHNAILNHSDEFLKVAEAAKSLVFELRRGPEISMSAQKSLDTLAVALACLELKEGI